MSQEILYTSAEAGLKRGSQGFCTVVSTAGMAQNLARQLEMLSGYRHAFAMNDSRASLNPVNYSHLSIQLAGRKYHVLSRIANAGVDYTQRSNKLAHHVALEESERISAGPAAVLATPGFCETNWDGTTQILPVGRTPSDQPESDSPCETWETVTGDSGWAGVVANHLTSEREKPISIIFPPGTDTLALTEEVLRLLPERRRWQVSFSTYFTKLPAGLKCQLRFVLDETAEATALRRHPHVAVLDICQNLGQAEEDGLVEIARVGRSLAPSRRPQVPDAPPLPPPGNVPVGSGSPIARRKSGTYTITPPNRRGRSFRKDSFNDEPNLPPDSKPRNTILIVAMVLLPLLLIGISVAGIVIYQVTRPAEEENLARRDSKRSSALAAPKNNVEKSIASNKKTQQPTKGKSGGKRKGKRNKRPGKPRQQKSTKKPNGKKTIPLPKKGTQIAKKGKGKPKVKPVPKKEDPFAKLDPVFVLPHPPEKLGPSNNGDSEKSITKTLGDIILKNKKQLLISIEQTKEEQDLLFSGGKFDVRRDEIMDNTWKVTLITKSKFGGTIVQAVGFFKLDGITFSFTWEKKISRVSRLLRFARLRLTSGKTIVYRQFKTHISRSTIPYFFMKTSKISFDIKLPEDLVVSRKQLDAHLQCEIRVVTPSLPQRKPVILMSGKDRDLFRELMMKKPFDKIDPKPYVKLVGSIANDTPIKITLIRTRSVVVLKLGKTIELPGKQILFTSVDWTRNIHPRHSNISKKQLNSFNTNSISQGLNSLCMDLFQLSFDAWKKKHAKNDDPATAMKKLEEWLPKQNFSGKGEKIIEYIQSMSNLAELLKTAKQVAGSYMKQDMFVENVSRKFADGNLHYTLFLQVGDRRIDLVKSK